MKKLWAAMGGMFTATSTACATTDDAPVAPSVEVTQSGLFVSSPSRSDFATTLEKLKTAITARELKIFAELDHAGGAASIGEELRPTTLIIFGHPKGGTPLLQQIQALGLELPLKILVLEDEGGDVRLLRRSMVSVVDDYAGTDVGADSAKANAVAEKMNGLLTQLEAEALN